MIRSVSAALRAIVVLVGVAVCLLAPLGAARGVEAADDPVARVIALTNVERQKAGLPPLVAQANLTQAASGYAAVLSSGSCFAHTCGLVPKFIDRAAQAGYTNWSALAENIAAGQRTPEAVVQAWMDSPGHRANILNPRYTEIGVGLKTGGRLGMYWAQNFGARRSAAAGTAGTPAPAPVPPAPTKAQTDTQGSTQSQIQLPRGASTCTFVLGFAQLAEVVGSAAGECTENERFNPGNGNAEQASTGGMFVWRKADNWTAFTDGYRTWINGPEGLQSRLNAQRFAWEGDPL